MSFPTITLQQLLDAFVDMAYLTDPSGLIVAYNRTKWNEFALANGAPELTDASHILGRSIFSFIAGEETQASYQGFAKTLIDKRRQDVTFRFFCDAPDMRRQMRLSISPIYNEGEPVALLYHSILLSASARPSMGILKLGKELSDAPLLGICSYCKVVRIPAGSQTGEWVSAERYYQLGGTDFVQLSHGICPSCYKDVVAEHLAT